MSINSKAYIVGAFEHPTRLAKDKSVGQLHAEVAQGALADAGLTRDDIDGYFCAGDAPGMGPTSMVEHLNIKARYLDSTDLGGASYLSLVSHCHGQMQCGTDHAGRPPAQRRHGHRHHTACARTFATRLRI
jgi:acetyl-CoA C-acetyltransferase